MLRFLFACTILCVSLSATAQQQRALLIAIDDYGAPHCDTRAVDEGGRKVCNLYGCKNDAASMKGIITTKFKFPAQGVAELYDQAASRNNIISAIKALLARSKAGDIAFIYYAGHGSQTRNSSSNAMREQDRMDESIVPADTKKKGILDIRDKELAALFNQYLDKGIHLTVIFDCCHSASMSRGEQYDTLMGRFAPSLTHDVRDPSSPRIPEDRIDSKGSFLIMSAAQSDQIAQELTDGNGKKHGAFTAAFITATNQLSVNASAIDIFKSIKTILLNNGKPNQDPTIAGLQARQEQTLFGIGKGKLSDRLTIPVASVQNGKVIFLAGFAQGLQPGNELSVASTTSGIANTKIKLVTVDGINKSTGTVVSGNISSVKPGQLFEVTNWVSPKTPLLKLFILPNQYSFEQADAIRQLAIQLKQSGKVNMITDLSASDPYLTIFYSNNTCNVSIQGAGTQQILTPTPDIIAKLANGKPVFFNLPAPADAATAIKQKFAKKNILFTDNVMDAQYLLYGILNEENNMAYGWRGLWMTVKNNLESMPAQTGHIALRDASGESVNRLSTGLSDYAMRLAKLRYWITLSGPVNANNYFPFRLQFVRANNQPVSNNSVKIGESYDLQMVDYSKPNEKPTEKFVYVFTMDKDGQMTLLYPDETDGNQNNKFPKYKEFPSWNERLKVIPLLKLQASEPVGTDHYFMIASEQQIPDYASLFNQDGIGANKRGGVATDNPFDVLLDMESETVSGRGGPAVTTGYTWNLLKYTLTVSR
jgi:hypothetical protein